MQMTERHPGHCTKCGRDSRPFNAPSCSVVLRCTEACSEASPAHGTIWLLPSLPANAGSLQRLKCPSHENRTGDDVPVFRGKCEHESSDRSVAVLLFETSVSSSHILQLACLFD